MLNEILDLSQVLETSLSLFDSISLNQTLGFNLNRTISQRDVPGGKVSQGLDMSNLTRIHIPQKDRSRGHRYHHHTKTSYYTMRIKRESFDFDNY